MLSLGLFTTHAGTMKAVSRTGVIHGVNAGACVPLHLLLAGKLGVKVRWLLHVRALWPQHAVHIASHHAGTRWV